MKVKCRLIFLLRHTSGSGIEWVHVDPGMEAALPLCRLGICTINSVTQFGATFHPLATDLPPEATLEELPRLPHSQSIRAMFSNGVRVLVVLSSKNLKPETALLLTSCYPSVCIGALAALAEQKTERNCREGVGNACINSEDTVENAPL